MNHLRSIWVLLVAGTLIFGTVACNKYEDGPLISLRSKKARVVNVWSANLIAANDKEITDTYKVYTLDFRKDNTFTWETSMSEDSTQINVLEGTWDFGGLKQELVLTSEAGPGSVFDEKLLYLDILQLKEKSLWVNFISSEGDRMYVRFSPK